MPTEPYRRLDPDRVRAMLGTSLQRFGYAQPSDSAPTHDRIAIEWVYCYSRASTDEMYILLGKYGHRDMVSFQRLNQAGRTIKYFYADEIGTKLGARSSGLEEAASLFRLKGERLVDAFVTVLLMETRRPRP